MEATDIQIQDFRQQHNEALMDNGHLEHQRRVDELTAMYQAKHGEVPETPTPAPTLGELAEKPLEPEQYDIGPASRFALNVGQHEGWDTETETKARDWMSKAGMSQAAAETVSYAYWEVHGDRFKADEAALASQQMIDRAYPAQSDVAIDAMRRVILEAGGESLKAWLNDTGLGNHPLVVREVLNLAERKGYISKGA